MNPYKYPGAKWWKFDFHTHTPASDDFSDKTITPEFWLQKFMEKEIDCVAITDHNSGVWIDKLKQKLEELRNNQPDWYRPLYLFPGVEISANGGVHILAIFGLEKSTSDIDSLIGAVGYTSTKGSSDGVTSKSITDVVNIITQHNGIAIPAHVDKKNGLFKKLPGNTLAQILDNKNIYSMELLDSEYQKPELYNSKKLQWTEIIGSDTHNFKQDTLDCFTWIKMDEPSIEGLKLALIDGKISVNRDMQDKPNQHTEFLIESIEIDKAKYIGRDDAFTCEFSPFLNTIIGSRGSSKSTLLEFMRFVFRRHKEIPEEGDSDKYFQVGGDNLLTTESRLSLIYRKNDTRYRLNWTADANINSLEVHDGSNWKSESGEINSLFPVHIYSQKQIFELSKDPQALLNIIDRDPQVAYENLQNNRWEFCNQYKKICHRIDELKKKIAKKNTLLGRTNDVARQIQQIEKSGHKEVLQNYRTRQLQLHAIQSIESEWQKMLESLKEVEKYASPISFDEQTFSNHNEILEALNKSNKEWTNIKEVVVKLSESAQSIIDNWQQVKNQSEWMTILKAEIAKYEQIKTQLAQQKIDPEKYPLLLQQQAQTKKDLSQIENYILEVRELEKKKTEIFNEIVKNREQLTKNRTTFLNDVLKDNQTVNITIKLFAEEKKRVEKQIRDILHCNDWRFEKDIEDLVYQNNFKVLKSNIKEIYNNQKQAQHGSFYNHLKKLSPEFLIDLELWFPEDDLNITFGKSNQKIRQGSPGQKCAALLAFILSYGAEPLLLDQPEDDLDNELIYDLIVKQIRATKSKRQIIIITHNANIVVNGDAEMVIPLLVENNKTHIKITASIQNQEIREKICNILEGGQDAFSQRYKRIHLED